MKLTILGSGTSNGVPQIGCRCRTCCSTDPRDKRLRCSSLIESDGGTRILIDCGPDFRQQILPLPSQHLDAIFITHEHYDHVGGLDDLRPTLLFDLNVYAEDYCAQHLMERIPYCFTPKEKRYLGVPSINLDHIEPHVPVTVGDISVLPFRVMHGTLPILGFRIGKLVYITDMSTLPDSEWQYIMGADTLIVNALHHRQHPSHQTVEQAVKFAQKIAARQTYFIHMSHFILPHEDEEALLPQGIHLAYDGLQITF